ncbi:hypothetical protein ACS0TY_007231 [Phlomoides rotata]
MHISYVPEEEIGGFDRMMKFVESREFQELNIGFMFDEGQTSVTDDFRVFYVDRSPWHMVIKATGMPGHGSRMYDNSVMENFMKSVEVIMKFRENILEACNESSTVEPSDTEAGFDLWLPRTTNPDLMRRRIAEEWVPAWRNMTYEMPNHK